jgi:uncharacterized protein YkwD
MLVGGHWKAFALVALAFAILAVPAPAAEISSAASLERGVLAEINAVRSAHGLAPLRFNVRLDRAATSHSRAMATLGFFSHASRDGSDFSKRIARFYPSSRYRYWAVGENLLWSSPDVDAAAAVEMWMNSPGHRRILLGARWREIGLSAVHTAAAPGMFGGREVTIVTADFGVRR